MALTRAEIDEIQDQIAAGRSPEVIAESLGRIAGLDLLDITTIRSVAYDLRNGDTVPASDD